MCEPEPVSVPMNVTEAYSYVEIIDSERDANVTSDVIFREFGAASAFFRGGFVLLLRMGFLLIEVTCIPVYDVQLVVAQNLVDIAAGSVAFCLVGYTLAFGNDVVGFIGGASGAANTLMSSEADLEAASRGWAAAMAVGALFVAGAAGRVPLSGVALASGLCAGLLQPLLIHWAWAPGGWQTGDTFRLTDQGSAVVVHCMGGSMALVTICVLGRRLVLLKDIDSRSLPGASPAAAGAGYLMVLLGVAAIGLPVGAYQVIGYQLPSRVLLNFVMAAAGGFVAAAIASICLKEPSDESHRLSHWPVVRCCQSTVAGCVTASSGCALYSPPIACLAGVVGGALHACTSFRCHKSAVEDTLAVIPCHLFCGALGPTLLAPLAAISDTPQHQTVGYIMHKLATQMLCVFASCTAAIIGAFVIIYIVLLLGILRNRSEERDHERAEELVSYLPHNPPFFQRIFPHTRGVYLQPGEGADVDKLPPSISYGQLRTNKGDGGGKTTVTELASEYETKTLRPNLLKNTEETRSPSPETKALAALTAKPSPPLMKYLEYPTTRPQVPTQTTAALVLVENMNMIPHSRKFARAVRHTKQRSPFTDRANREEVNASYRAESYTVEHITVTDGKDVGQGDRPNDEMATRVTVRADVHAGDARPPPPSAFEKKMKKLGYKATKAPPGLKDKATNTVVSFPTDESEDASKVKSANKSISYTAGEKVSSDKKPTS